MATIPRQIVSVRVDCNAETGYGHINRCLSVADCLRFESAVKVRFLMSSDSNCDLVEKPGFEIRRIDADTSLFDGIADHANPQDGPLLIDSYAVGDQDIDKLWKAGFRVALFDDGCRLGRYACNAVFDSSPMAPSLPYHGIEETRFFLGSEYFPLRNDFKQSMRSDRTSRTVDAVVVTFGGSDPDDATAHTLKELSALDGDFDIVAILGPAYQGRAEDIAAGNSRVRLMRDVDHMAPVLCDADIVISGAGSTASEIAFLGIPMVLLALSDNQVPVAEGMSAAGASVYLGRHGKAGTAKIGETLTGLMRDWRARDAMRVAGQAQIDGKGTQRITNAILSMAPAQAGEVK